MSQQQNNLEKLNAVKKRIASAEQLAGRSAESVRLIGASKQQTADLITRYVESGLTDIGENYLQEAISKYNEINEPDLNWHFIGQIQSNKTKLIAQYFSWVHGVDRLKIAQRLASQNPHKKPIHILLQLNLDNETSKGGVSLNDAPALADQIANLDGVSMAGFMAIPKARKHADEQRAVFAQAYELLQQTNQQYGLQLQELSMGMSGDLEAAIAEGSTMVRIGTDLFGARL